MAEMIGVSFNEAEALKPRIPEITRWPPDGKNRFNEAEALKPRIHKRYAGRVRWLIWSFNEAEALKPRIPGLHGRCGAAVNGLQ